MAVTSTNKQTKLEIISSTKIYINLNIFVMNVFDGICGDPKNEQKNIKKE